MSDRVKELIGIGVTPGAVAKKLRLTMAEVAWHQNPAEHTPEEWAVLFQNRGVPIERIKHLLGVEPLGILPTKPEVLTMREWAITLHLAGKSDDLIAECTGLDIQGWFDPKSELYYKRPRRIPDKPIVRPAVAESPFDVAQRRINRGETWRTVAASMGMTKQALHKALCEGKHERTGS